MNGNLTDVAQSADAPDASQELNAAWAAVTKFLGWIDEDPDDAGTWEICGRALRIQALKCRQEANSEILNREALVRFEKALSILPDSPRSLFGKACCMMDAAERPGHRAQLLEAESCLARLCSFSTVDAGSWHQWARCCGLLASSTPGPDEERKWRQRACDTDAEAVRLAGDDNWMVLSAGINLRWLGDRLEPGEQGGIYLQALEYFSRASALKPEGALEFFHWAETLRSLAGITADEERKEVYLRDAVARARDAIERKETEDYFSLLAQCLEDLADALEAPEKVALYEEALVWQERALELEPSNAWGHRFCARLLFKLSKEAEGEQMAGLLRRTVSHHASADTLQEDSYDLYRWAVALENLSEEEDGELADEHLQEARSRVARASELEPEEASYLKKWGRLLSLIADGRDSSPVEQNNLRIEALEKLTRSLHICASDDVAWLYQGQVLSDLGDGARANDSALARTYWERSAESFSRSAELDPAWDSPWGWKGSILADIARISENRDEAIRLFMESDHCFATAVSLDPGYDSHFRLWALALLGLAREENSLERRRELYHTIREKWMRALELVPDNSDALEGVADALIEMAELSEVTERLPLLDEALRYCELALEDSDDRSDVLLLWANALRDKAALIEDRDEKIAILRASIDRSERAAEEDPDQWIIPFNLGHTLHYLSLKVESKHERVDLLMRSTMSYVLAWQLNPENSRAASFAADGYESLATQGEDRQKNARLLESALQYRRIASGNDLENPEYLGDWGNTLSLLATVIDDSKMEARLLDQAESKFKAALKLNQAEGDSWLGWGRVLLDRAEDGFDLDGRSRLLARARRKLEKAAACDEGEAFFELARIEARQRHVEAAMSALRQWRNLIGSASVRTIRDCSDFDDLSSDITFQTFLAEWDS